MWFRLPVLFSKIFKNREEDFYWAPNSPVPSPTYPSARLFYSAEKRSQFEAPPEQDAIQDDGLISFYIRAPTSDRARPSSGDPLPAQPDPPLRRGQQKRRDLFLL